MPCKYLETQDIGNNKQKDLGRMSVLGSRDKKKMSVTRTWCVKEKVDQDEFKEVARDPTTQGLLGMVESTECVDMYKRK